MTQNEKIPHRRSIRYRRDEETEKVGTGSPQFRTPPDAVIQRLSYSHMELIVDFDDDLKRAFYEIEGLRGNWPVRELKRQI